METARRKSDLSSGALAMQCSITLSRGAASDSFQISFFPVYNPLCQVSWCGNSSVTEIRRFISCYLCVSQNVWTFSRHSIGQSASSECHTGPFSQSRDFRIWLNPDISVHVRLCLRCFCVLSVILLLSITHTYTYKKPR